MIHKELHEANRRSWNAATRAHNSHKGDQAAYFRAGGSTLYPEELALLGDVRGRRLVHLQCNAGQDTLSLARLGAEVTGVDISDEAVDFATALAHDSGLPARFVRADVYDWLAAGPGPFDVAFCSYGAIGWLSDLELWARGVAAILAPGGRLVTVEFHPIAAMFDDAKVLRHPGGGGAPLTWDDGVPDYVALSGPALTHGTFHEGTVDFKNPHPVHEFSWSIAEIITALLGAGLTIETFREYPHSNGYKMFADMTFADGRWLQPAGPELPLMFGLVARR
jgi:SAM-dependent methyltransferase